MIRKENEAGHEQQEAPESTYIEKMLEANPIDSYFSDMADKMKPETTVDMMIFNDVFCSAWKAEMTSCYEILSGKTNIEALGKYLEDELASYAEYVEIRTQRFNYRR